jgi:hypothetical protein
VFRVYFTRSGALAGAYRFAPKLAAAHRYYDASKTFVTLTPATGPLTGETSAVASSICNKAPGFIYSFLVYLISNEFKMFYGFILLLSMGLSVDSVRFDLGSIAAFGVQAKPSSRSR